MSDTHDDLKPDGKSFDFSAFPPNTVFHERRTGKERRDVAPPAVQPVAASQPAVGKPLERRARKERRKRIDPTTFEKQYTDEEMEFMNAMQRFKEHTGKPFPSYGEVVRVAVSLGYRKIVDDSPPPVLDENARFLLFPITEQDA